MKTRMLFIILSLTISSFASQIPEAQNLHPELYTIQFTLAELPDDFEIQTEAELGAYKNFNNLSPAEKAKLSTSMREGKIKRIQSSDAKYTNLATIHSEAGQIFSGEDGVVKGMLNPESNTLDILELAVPNYETRGPLTIDMKSKSWFTMFMGGKIVDGKEKKYCVLVKCYAPKK